MNGRKVNRAFLISILLYTGCIFGLVYVLPELFSGIVINNLICETIVILPGILFAAFSEERLPEFLHLKKLKPGTILAVIPFTMFSMPFITLINLISQFFVENTAAAMMEGYQVTEMPFWQLWLSIGVFAPFCEETACRGVLGTVWKEEKINSHSQIYDNQGETDISENTGKKDKLVTVPLILALILCIVIITLTMLPVNS